MSNPLFVVLAVVFVSVLMVGTTATATGPGASSGQRAASAPSGVAKVGPHGGVIVSSKEGDFEVAVDEAKHLLDVYTLKPVRAKLPGDLKVKLGGRKNPQEFYLRAADPWQGLPHYQGTYLPSHTLHPGNLQQKGVELEFRFSR